MAVDVGQWTDARVERLITLWGSGLSTAQIGIVIGCTRNAVVGKAHRLALQPRPSPIKPSAGPPIIRAPRSTRATLKPLGSQAQNEVAIGAADQRAIDAVTLADRVLAKPRPRIEPFPAALPLSSHATCQYVIGDGRPWIVCDQPAVLGMSWCPHHRRVVFIRHPREWRAPRIEDLGR